MEIRGKRGTVRVGDATFQIEGWRAEIKPYGVSFDELLVLARKVLANKPDRLSVKRPLWSRLKRAYSMACEAKTEEQADRWRQRLAALLLSLGG